MSRSRPNSRPVSRSNSISEAPINIPVDPRIHAMRPAQAERDASYTERAAHWLKKDGAHDQQHHRKHNDQDPKLFVSSSHTHKDTCLITGSLET